MTKFLYHVTLKSNKDKINNRKLKYTTEPHITYTPCYTQYFYLLLLIYMMKKLIKNYEKPKN
jgi:hypothetical protein